MDDISFLQTDYYRLIYNPGHHHFVRDFAVLFDEPIGGACGLRIEDITPGNSGDTPQIHTVNCNLDKKGKRGFTSHTFDQSGRDK